MANTTSRLAVGLAAVLALGLPATLGAAPAPSTPRAFVVWIYSHYPEPEHSTFDPMGRTAPQVFDPPMVALLREDTRLAGGEVGAIDADLFCQCQDDGDMRSRISDVRTTGAASATAIVIVSFPGPQASAPNPIILSLVRLNGQWRVHDIITADTPSLRAMLTKANAEARRGHH